MRLKKVAKPKQIACCLHCQSTHFVKNSKKCGHQKHLCCNSNCKKSFVEQTGTIMYGSQKTLLLGKIHSLHG
ncbi:IS1/IS1595 family N-terminal zinc-binding domain-containing protein [Pasteurella bettyae]